LALLVTQLRFKNKIFGIVLSLVFMVLCMYMMLAIFSDIIDLDAFYPRGLLMIVFGVFYFGTTAYFAFTLLRKNNSTMNDRLPIGND
ncbi:MAG: hypothetical protein ACI9R6_001014, partial [Saprospiraceae bacterium]